MKKHPTCRSAAQMAITLKLQAALFRGELEGKFMKKYTRGESMKMDFQ